MAVDFWNDDETEEVTGEFVVTGGGDFQLIPHETRVLAMIDEAKFDFKEPFGSDVAEDCTKLRFTILKPECFANQKLFKTFWTETGGDEKLKRDRSMFMAIDKNAGGRLAALGRKPTDAELSKALLNKQMVVVVGLMKAKKVGDEDRNYIMGVSSDKSTVSTNVKAQAQKAKSTVDDDDIPF